MPEQANSTIRLTMSCGAEYRICVQGLIERTWATIFTRMTVSYRNRSASNAVTVLTGRVQDQADLLGLVNHLHALGLPLVSVQWRKKERSVA